MRNSNLIPSPNAEIDWKGWINPPVFYWPGYMWIWNDKVTPEQTVTQIQEMARERAMTPMVVPEPKGFRPKTMPTRLEPEYLSPEYLAQYRFMVESVAKANMNVWLYDEGGWPSGSVCGELVKRYPQLASQQLLRKSIWVWKGRTIQIPTDELMTGLYQKRVVGNNFHQEFQFIRILTPGSKVKIDIPNAKVLQFRVQKGGSYPDLLNPETTKRFLNLTHEKYKQELATFFGKTISLVFTDEPKVIAKPPWTDGLLEDFLRTKGYDLLPHLHSIFGGSTKEDQEVRIDFADWWSQRFASTYFGQLQQWCQANQILSGGHLNGEDETLGALYHGFGHVLRPYRYMDVPGIDVIWRQIWPGKVNHHFPKYASSVAHQQGKRWVLSESFAVFGSGLTPIQMKWIIDYQIVRGINLFDLACYQYSNQDWFIGGERPVFGPQNPIWPAMAKLHQYIARLAYLFSQGEPDLTVAVYYPVRDIWANGPDTRKVARGNDEVARKLLEHQCDFDFIDDDLLNSPETIITSGKIIMGKMKYTHLVVSQNRWMTPRARERLSQFVQAGGKVYWVLDGQAQSACSPFSPPEGILSCDIQTFTGDIPRIIKVTPTNPHIRVCRRKMQNGTLYFITSEAMTDQECTITFQEHLPAVQIDPVSANCYALPNAKLVSEGVQIPLQFNFGESKIIYFTNENLLLVQLLTPIKPKTLLRTLVQGWKARKIQSYKIEQHGIHIQELSNDSPPSQILLGDWQQWAGADYSGTIEYQIAFESSPEMAKQATILDLGIVNYFCEVIVNGTNIGQRIWAPFWFDVKGILRPENNHLVIRVSNTFANQYLAVKWKKLWPKKFLGPYHPKTLRFEAESCSSGLFGPVRLLSG